MAQNTAASTVHDVIVVGSGAGGGTVTKVLADLGVSVLLMEAGPMLTSATSRSTCGRTTCHIAAPGRRARPTPAGQPASPTAPPTAARSFRRAVHRRAWQRLLVVPLAHPRRPHQSLRPRHAALRRLRLQAARRVTVSVSTGRSAMRTSRRTTTRRRSSSASSARVEKIRSAPDGIFDTPGALQRARHARAAIVREAQHPRRAEPPGSNDAANETGGAGCHYCGQCGRGCMTASNYASSYVQIFPAMKTGRVQVLANAMARELITDAVGKGHGSLVHRQERRHRKNRSAAEPSCSRRAHASRRACSSTRSRHATLRASRTRPAWSGAT